MIGILVGQWRSCSVLSLRGDFDRLLKKTVKEWNKLSHTWKQKVYSVSCAAQYSYFRQGKANEICEGT